MPPSAFLTTCPIPTSRFPSRHPHRRPRPRGTLQSRRLHSAICIHPLTTCEMTTTTPIPTFSKFFISFFRRRFPGLALLLRDEQAALAATVYLFRYDTRLSVEFITRNVDALSRAIADATGKSIPESKRLFTSAVRDAARDYFKDGWTEIQRFITANAKELTAVQLQSTKFSAVTDELEREPAPQVDPVLLKRLLEQRLPVIVLVYADYCSVCKQVRPVFEQASMEMGSKMFFVKLNGPRAPEVKDEYDVTAYPTILRCDNDMEVKHFPKYTHQMNLENILAFAKNEDLQPAVSDDDNDSDGGLRELSHRRSRTAEWEAILERQGIDELDALRIERKQALHPAIKPMPEDSDLECTATSCSLSPHRSHDLEAGDPPPLCVLLGGGMGAGKTTAVGLISETPFWKKYGSTAVVVEADAFKLNDPLFQVLQSVTPMASRIVHQDSIAAAEELFLKAVNARRDVVFDGTLSWCEYARQTVAMLKDTEYYWKRGPGYVEDENGVVEQYWARDEKRKRPAVEYNIELVGVTAHPEISVMRGIVRKITTGRAVPVADQLRSHALFSRHFEEYIDLVQATYLFDTTMNESLVDGKGVEYASQLVAIKPGMLFSNPDEIDDDGDEFVVRSAPAYERFLRKKFLNTSAEGLDELYDPSILATCE